MTLIQYEIKKLRSAKVTFLIVVLLIAAGLMYIFWQLTESNNSCSLVQQAQLFHSLETDDLNEMMERLTSLRDEQITALTSSIGIAEGAASEEFAQYSKQLVLYSTLLSELETVNSFERILEGLIEGTDSISGLMTESEYRQRDQTAARRAYEQLIGTDLSPVFSGGIELVLDQPVLDLILMLITAIFVLFLFQSEFDSGTLVYIRMTANGVLPTLAAKLVVLVGFLMFSTLFLYGGGLAMVCWMTGILPWSAPAQSIAALVRCPFPISICEFIILFFSAKFLAILTMCLLFALLCVIWKDTVAASVSFGMILGSEWLLYRYISPFSTTGVLSQINLMRIWDSLSLFSKWETIDLMNYPIPRWTLRSVLLIVLALASFIGIVLFFSPPHSCEPRSFFYKNRLRKFKSGKLPGTHSLFHYESKKLWCIEKCGVLLAALILIQLFNCAGIHRWMNTDEIFYARYIKLLVGVPSTEKDNVVSQITADFSEKERLLNLAAEQLLDGDINEREYSILIDMYSVSDSQKAGWERAFGDYNRVVELRKQGIDAYCVGQDGWELLFGLTGLAADCLQFLFLVVGLILGLSNYAAMERTSGMMPLLGLYPKWRQAERDKHIHAILYAVALTIVAFLPRRLAVMDCYDITLGGWPVQSLRLLDDFPIYLPIWLLFGLQLLLNIVLATIAGEVVLTLSTKTKNRFITMLLGAMILIIPVCMVWSMAAS